MVLFNQLTLRNILNICEVLGTSELRVAVAALTNEQHADTVCFLMHDTERLAGLPDGQVKQAVANLQFSGQNINTNIIFGMKK